MLNKEMVAYFWPFLREDKWKLGLSMLLVLITGTSPTIMSLLPWLLTSHWNRERVQFLWWNTERVHLLWWGLVGLLLLTVIFSFLSWVGTYIDAEVSQNFYRRIRVAILRKIGHLPAMAMNEQSIGSLAYRSTNDVMRVQGFLLSSLPGALSNVARLSYSLIALFLLGPVFTVIGLVLAPIVWIFVRRLNRRLRDYARLGQTQGEAIMTRFIEGVSGYRDLVAAGRFNEAVRAFDRRLDEYRRVQIRTSMIDYWAATIPVFGFTLLIFAYYIARTADPSMIGDMAYMGKVMTFAVLIGQVQGPALGLANFSTDAALSAPSFYETRLLLQAPEVGDIPEGRMPANSNVELDGVSFSYAPGTPPILDNVSLKIESGSFTAIVGQTGSGKSTLFYLLLRLLEPDSGEIRLGGIPLRKMSLVNLREYIGFIPQSPFIFDTTIRENLCMGVPQDQFEEQRINEAIRTARLEKLVTGRRQAGGVDAPVGPGGSTLSGGERQRIALGRIFLRDPQIIVCDEYTANIDNATARLIHEALQKVFAGKTRVVITHQLYTVRGADKILVLDRGQIVASGTHQELIQQSGLYREMWEVQRLE
jgi:ABC-type multidrug transport system fused ATPase/permease subunit